MNVQPVSSPAQASTADIYRRSHPPTQHDQLVHQSQRLVAQAFYGPMLKQMRESPFKSKLFSGGRGGEVFSQMLDQHLADRMTRGAGSKNAKHGLVHAIVRKIEGTRHTDGAPALNALQRSAKTIRPPAQKVSTNVSAGIRA